MKKSKLTKPALAAVMTSKNGSYSQKPRRTKLLPSLPPSAKVFGGGPEVRRIKKEESSKRLAGLAGKTLRNPRASRVAKSLAGSVLTQTPDKRAKKRSD